MGGKPTRKGGEGRFDGGEGDWILFGDSPDGIEGCSEGY